MRMYRIKFPNLLITEIINKIDFCKEKQCTALPIFCHLYPFYCQIYENNYEFDIKIMTS